ncbi:hypothetical protein [Streptomyces sp. NPDC056061]|uniref:hypothetical protein n=1 Tax=Streptomyces sp. NPDC056061 TaxID=3345700 RepID=UPI0035D93C66
MTDDHTHALPDTGAPDAFMRAAHARRLRQMRARRRITLPLAVLTILVTAIGLINLDWVWWMTLPSGFCVLILLGCVNLVSDDETERPGPDTALEVACVVGVEITSWARADSGGIHHVRVIARPLGSSTGQLVHGYRIFSAERGCRIAPGMLFGFRRHPTMKHLVWIEPQHDPLTLLHRREGTGAAPNTRPEDATVESVAVLASASASAPVPVAVPIPIPIPIPVAVAAADEHEGDWWKTRITVRTDDGTRLVETLDRLPEELGQFAHGQRVQVIRHQGAHGTAATTCSIVPRTL